MKLIKPIIVGAAVVTTFAFAASTVAIGAKPV
jgi:hypothetical protein